MTTVIDCMKLLIVNETVTLLDTELPETGDGMWCSGALAHDGCIYCMPFNARRILKFNPEDESAASVGEDLGEDHQHDMEMNYEDTVLGTNGWFLYGIPYCSNHIVRFNPTDA